ncbi:MAG: ABC transporter permease [Lachnospiraceae bacterium]|nr:ABC transporter permease [Lachnospiraceae bacterium]
MIKLNLQKIKNQKWLSFCLVLGMALLIAALCCQPMFKKGSLDRSLQQMFTDYIAENNQYPVVFQRSGDYSVEDLKDVDSVHSKMQEYQGIWEKYIDDIPVMAKQTRYSLAAMSGLGDFKERNVFFEMNYMPDMLEHVTIVKGDDYSTYEGDAIPCIISESVLDKRNLLVGEKITFDKYVDGEGKELQLVIAGVFDIKDDNDPFWYYSPYVNEKEIFISKEAFDEIKDANAMDVIHYEHAAIFNHETIDSSKVDNLIYYIDEFKKQDASFKVSVTSLLDRFTSKRASISVMLWVLELPILGMVFAFIYMVSRQIVDSESGEIAMLKSRGFSRFQIIKMYTVQSGLLAIGGMIFGLPLGYVICKIAASTTNFLTFNGQESSYYKFVPQMLLYGLLGVVVGIVLILVPVLQRSKISIVEQKSNYSVGKKMLWEKCFLDVALLGVSVYLLYNYLKSIEQIREKAIAANKMDPMVFLNTCLFIVAAGLVVFRLMHYFSQLVYSLGKNKWKPVTYVSFLQITRSFRKQCFISVFMIMTVSLGLFNANVARTINQNNANRIEYSTGADVVSNERWNFRDWLASDNKNHRRYIEADFSKYEELVEAGYCNHVARVYNLNKTKVTKGTASIEGCDVMGVETNKFGETASFKDSFNTGEHWYNYLNTLSQNGRGVLVSRNLAKALNLDVDSKIEFYGLEKTNVDTSKVMNCVVVGIFDNWPGYNQYYYENGEEKENYLIVANYAPMVQNVEIMPYQIWYDLEDGVSADQLYDHLIETGIDITKFVSISDQIEKLASTPDIQITNGLFTLSFIIALVLCGVGFLIYWIAAIRKRELLFGVYRAMGLSVKNINRMLIYEHIFSTLLSVIAGGIVGITSTFLFIKLFCVVYLPERSNISIETYFEVGDMIKLFASLTIMIIVCMLVLRRQVKKLNITQALKLGED